MYAIKIEPNALAFLAERPKGDWPIEEGVEIDIPSNYSTWAEGSDRPQTMLCVSMSEPNCFKLYKYASEIDWSEYRPTNMTFAGVFSRSAWERFAKLLSSSVAGQPEGSSNELPGATDEAISALRGRS